MEKLKELNKNIISYCANKRESNIDSYKRYIRIGDILTLSSVFVFNYSFINYFNNDFMIMFPLVTIISIYTFMIFRISITVDGIRYYVKNKTEGTYRRDIDYYSSNFKKIKKMDLFSILMLSYIFSIVISFGFSTGFHFIVSEYTKHGYFTLGGAVMLAIMLSTMSLLFFSTKTNKGEKKSEKEMLEMKSKIESDLKLLVDRGNSTDLNNILLLRKGVKESELKDSVLSDLLTQKLDEELKKNGVSTIEDYLLEKNKELVLLEND